MNNNIATITLAKMDHNLGRTVTIRYFAVVHQGRMLPGRWFNLKDAVRAAIATGAKTVRDGYSNGHGGEDFVAKYVREIKDADSEMSEMIEKWEIGDARRLLRDMLSAGI